MPIISTTWQLKCSRLCQKYFSSPLLLPPSHSTSLSLPFNLSLSQPYFSLHLSLFTNLSLSIYSSLCNPSQPFSLSHSFSPSFSPSFSLIQFPPLTATSLYLSNSLPPSPSFNFPLSQHYFSLPISLFILLSLLISLSLCNPSQSSSFSLFQFPSSLCNPS